MSRSVDRSGSSFLAIVAGSGFALAALASASCDNEEATGESGAEICVDQGNGQGSIVHQQGACRELELLVTVNFQRSQILDATVTLTSPLRFSFPAAIPVLVGNAGNKDAHLTFTNSANVMVDCLYRGGASVAHPTSPSDIQNGKSFSFVSCSDQSQIGEFSTSSGFNLHIDGDNRDPARMIVARLVLDEVAPCAPLDGGVDAADAADARDADAADVRDADADVRDADAADVRDADAADVRDADAAGVDAADARDADAADVSQDADARVPRCGDGIRDPNEECDLGSMVSSRALCTAMCRARDQLGIVEPTDAAVPPGRTIGEGRHPVAVGDNGSLGIVFVESDAKPLRLSLTTFTPGGTATDAFVPISVGTTALLMSNPIVAPVSNGKFAVAYTDFNGDGDELGVALRLIDPAVTPSGPPAHANATTAFSQYDPDLIATSTGLVAAWVDDSDGSTNPKLKYRLFAFDLTPVSDELDLAMMSTPASEGNVALAPWGSSWAAAWRSGDGGLETLQVRSGTTFWSIGPYLPGPVSARPALAELDATHLLVVYTEGTDPTDSGVANGSKLRIAVLDSTATGMIAPLDVTSMLTPGLSQDQPNAVRTGGQVFIAWRTESPLGVDAGAANGEELWLKPIGWNGSMLDSTAPEIALPRDTIHRAGDQRTPALAAGSLATGGAQLGVAFDDLGRIFVDAGKGNGDIVVESIPIPILRGP